MTDPGPGMPFDAHDEVDVVLSKDVFRVIWRRLWVIGLAAVVFAASAVGLSFLQAPEYTASIKVVVGQEQKNAQSVNLGSDVVGLQQFTQTVSELVATRPVAEAVIQQLDLRTTPDDFLRNMSVQQVEETQVLEISYTGADPRGAQKTANAIGEGFSKLVSEASPGGNAISATVWERAAVPDSPVSPNPLRNGILALMLGGMLGLAIVFLLEHLDDRWSSPEEVEQVSGVPTFGVVRTFRSSR